MFQKKYLITILLLNIFLIITFYYWKQINNGDTKLSARFVQITKTEFLNIQELSPKAHNFEQGLLSYNDKSFPIFINGKLDYISNQIRLNKIWEKTWLDQILLFMKKNSKAQFIDMGCNFGVHTIVVASIGRNVIAIDANRNNTDRLVQSLVKNKLTENVKVILNAVSNVRKLFSIYLDETNIGGQYLTERKNNSYSIKSILINDLLAITNEKDEYIIKIDIEGSEIDSVTAASEFLSKRNVPIILMEWNLIRRYKNCGSLIDFLMKRYYTAYPDFFSKSQLPLWNYLEWPYDIVWRKTELTQG